MSINALSSSAPLSKPNKFKYNGKEEQTEFDINIYDYGARNYDPQLGRFFNQDRFAEKYYDLNPYQYAWNNPSKYIDVNGDSVDVSDVLKNAGYFAERLDNDLESVTGLELSANSNGKLEYATEKGFLGIRRAKVSRDENGKKIGSGKARRTLKRAIRNKTDIDVIVGASGMSVPLDSKGKPMNIINFDPTDVGQKQDGLSPDLNQQTVGLALTTIHEILHTPVGGGHPDTQSDTAQGPTTRRVNRMRRQLGGDYGIRTSYNPTTIDGRDFVPFSRKARRKLRRGKIPKSGVMEIN